MNKYLRVVFSDIKVLLSDLMRFIRVNFEIIIFVTVFATVFSGTLHSLNGVGNFSDGDKVGLAFLFTILFTGVLLVLSVFAIAVYDYLKSVKARAEK